MVLQGTAENLGRGSDVARRSAIGLDIGTSGVRAAELSFRGGNATLEKFGQIALPEGAVRDGEVIDEGIVGERIRHLFSVTGFSHKRVVLGIANQRVVVRPLDLPDLPAKDMKKALPYQVQELLPMPVDQAVLDFHKTEVVQGETGPVARGMLVAASRDGVMSAVRAARSAGLTPESVDLSSFAVLRALGTMTTQGPHPDSPAEALVDIGARVTSVIVHSQGVPLFVRILLLGGQDITDALSERLGVTTMEAEGLKQQLGLLVTEGEWANSARVISAQAQTLVDEVRGSLDYYASTNHEHPVRRVVVTGGGSQLSGLTERLAATTRCDVAVGNPTHSLNIGNTGLNDEQMAIIGPLAAVPVGLAMGAAA